MFVSFIPFFTAIFANTKNEDIAYLYVVTTGSFTKDASGLARDQERRRITLIDRERLVELWIDYQDKVELDKRDALPLKPIYFLAPEE